MSVNEVIINTAKGSEQPMLLFTIYFFVAVFIYLQYALWGSGYFYLQLFFGVFLFLMVAILSYLAAIDTELVFNPQSQSIYARNLIFGKQFFGVSKPFNLADYDYIYIPTFDAQADRSGRYFVTLFSTKFGEQALYRVDKQVAEIELDRVSQVLNLPNKGFLDHIGFRAHSGRRQ